MIILEYSISRSHVIDKSYRLNELMIIEPVQKKTNNFGSDQARLKSGCTVTEDGKKLEILDLDRR